ncbi:heme exporter protein CcmD [Rubellimicrobium roseum]|uniref:Heme exporter protein D n=1 Tax=Rubellimicrobium roseum TaxID=687525 RepID=A0A5C4NFL6_9RHOB|nr:heme exporter protein CcmD [Rubellimicrobium roseum]TNC73443.1 heme exporter protein CcmD [Rubellimicrobium roseum]
MIPDLGRYATEVLSAYGVTVLLLAAVTGQSWRRYRRLKAQMDDAERSRRDG